MSKGHIIETIKSSAFNIIKDEYKKYLQSRNLLLLNNDILSGVVEDYYNNNSITIKSQIRDSLKEKYKEDYNSGLTEIILLDIFQEKDINIKNIVNEILIIQEANLKQFTIPIINNSLNLNISLLDNYVIINSANPKKIEGYNDIYEAISSYKFLYSINGDLLQDYPEDQKINVIKKHIELAEDSINMQCYYLKAQ